MASDALKKLISDSKRNLEVITLPPEAMADLKEVVKSNDKEPNHKRRVSMDRFVKHLREAHDVHLSTKTLRLIMQRDLGRDWLRQ